MSLLVSRTFSLAIADQIATASIAAVKDLTKHKPVSVTVVDNSGAVIVQKRMDGCPAGAYLKFSEIKARTCISLQSSSRTFREKYTAANEAPKFTQASASVVVTEGNLIPVAGGVLVTDENGEVLGAVGVSGAAADEDEYLAWIGVKRTVGLEDCVTSPSEHCCTTLSNL